jgi:hypothetical protein
VGRRPVTIAEGKVTGLQLGRLHLANPSAGVLDRAFTSAHIDGIVSFKPFHGRTIILNDPHRQVSIGPP